MKSVEQLKAKLLSVTAEEQELLSESLPLREEREALNKELLATRAKVDGLTVRINATHGTRLRELKMSKGKIATALQSVREADKLAAELS